jgi:hypothetical protein
MSDDPIAAAFEQYEPAPRDVVPRRVEHTVDDLRRLADGRTAVKVVHYEYGADGVTRHESWTTIARPIINPELEE